MEDSTVNFINAADFNRIIAAIPRLKIRKWYDKDVEMLFKILYWSALRPGEGIRLKKEDIDLKNCVIYLGKTKTRTTDKAQIKYDFVPELNEWLQEKSNGSLFPGLSYHVLYSWIIRLGKMLDIEAWIIPEYRSSEKTKGHIFRKSIGKSMLAGDFGEDAQNISVIAGLMRHSKPSTTMDHYLKVSEKALSDVWSRPKKTQ